MLAITGASISFGIASSCSRGLDPVEEHNVGAGGEVLARAREGVVKAGHGDRIGAGDDQEVGIAPGVDAASQPADVGGGADQPLALVVPAAPRHVLILEVQTGRPHVLHLPHQPLDREHRSEAGLAVGEHRQAGCPNRASDLRDRLGQRARAEVRHPGNDDELRPPEK